MSPRKHLAARHPGGRIKTPARDPELLAPAELHRLLDAARCGLRDATWGTMLGRLLLSGKITATEASAGRRWAALVENYATACQAPRPPQSASLDKMGGTPVDPDSVAGRKQAKIHERDTARWLEGRNALKNAGRDAEHAVAQCIQDYVPTGFAELQALRAGLSALAACFAAKRKAPARCS
ncbi:hypothetical protein [Bradyrhizobium sp. 604_D8_N2_3]|uniref:hypothetical protein n=1 Tax=Bradyrhizobium sp. 604_D8_N2_3 TaxID=3240370 RepID=UPI003F1FAE34